MIKCTIPLPDGKAIIVEYSSTDIGDNVPLFIEDTETGDKKFLI